MAAYISEALFSPMFRGAFQDQYIELRGEPNSSLADKTYLIAISSASGAFNLGDVHAIFDLSGQQFGANGYLVLMHSTGGFTVDPNARLIQGTDGFRGMPGTIFTADFPYNNIHGYSNTFLLIQGGEKPSLGTDIDANDDGKPDGDYLTWNILDGFAALSRIDTGTAQRGYAPINFSEGGVGVGLPGSTTVTTAEFGYVARTNSSTGYGPNDWLAANVNDIDVGSIRWRYEIVTGSIGTPRPVAYAGMYLDHVGSNNWSGSIRGNVYRDVNNNGVRESNESAISGMTVAATLPGDSTVGGYTINIEPDNYALQTVLTNVSPFVTLTVADANNAQVLGRVLSTSSLYQPTNRVFGDGGSEYFTNTTRLRMDFFKTAKSVSIKVSNDSLLKLFGRLEIFNAAGTSLGFVRSRAISNGESDRMTISSPNADIAYAVAYSDSVDFSYIFGGFDSLSIVVPELTAVTDVDGNYVLPWLPRGNYDIAARVPAAYEITAPASGKTSVAYQSTPTLSGINFGLRGTQPPRLDDQRFSVSESLATGSVLATLPVNFGYPTQTLNATITSGDSEGLFAIDATTLQLKLVKGRLDFETRQTYSLAVRLEDTANANLNDTAILDLTIADANEAPVVTTRTVSLAENSSVGNQVTTMTAIDVDAGAAGEYRWSITSGNINNAFAIDAVSGEVTVANSAPLDFETNPVIRLTVRASDLGTPPLFGEAELTITLTNVNEAPTILAQALSIRENRSAGTVVGTLSATDPDAGDRLTWSLSDGTNASLFGIDAQTGIVTFVGSAPLDFENLIPIQLVVSVADAGSPAMTNTRTFSVTILDENDPPKLESFSFDLDENSIAGSQVGTVVGTDQDAGQTLSYALSGSAASKFVIDGATGRISVATGAVLDFESTPTIGLTLSVTDNASAPATTESAVTIRLRNINEAPTIVSLNPTLPENSEAGTIVEAFLARDPDASDPLRFEILSQTQNWLEIDPDSGALRVTAGAVINFEVARQATVVVRATDAGGLSVTTTFTATATNVNDPPKLANALVDASAKANQAFSYSIPPTTFTDEDIGDQLRYFVTLASGFPLPAWLSFDSASGTLSGTPTVGDGGTVGIRVTAVDNGGAVAVAAVSIVVDANLFPWHNASMPLDVSGDKRITAFDALLVINYVNTKGAGKIPAGSAPTDGLLDTNKDNSVSAIDVLLIINDLNTRSSSEGEMSMPSSSAALDTIFDDLFLGINRRRRIS